MGNNNKKLQKLNGHIRVKIGKFTSKPNMQGKLNQGLKTGKCLKLYDANIAEIIGTFENGILKVKIDIQNLYSNSLNIIITMGNTNEG